MPNVYRKYDSKSGVWADFGDLNARKDIGIVEDTDIAEHSIASGQYVIWKGKLYTANSAITPDTTLSTSNLTEVTIGGLNDVKTKIENYFSNLIHVTGTNCEAYYIKIGRFVFAILCQTVVDAVYPLPIMSTTFFNSQYKFAITSVMRNATRGGMITAEGWNQGTSGIFMRANGHSSGDYLIGFIAYFAN